MRISGEEVKALGASLADAGLFVSTVPDAIRASGWACGPGETAAALTDLVASWEHQRHVLARALDGLARAAMGAGAGYVALEEGLSRLTTGGPR